MKTPLTSKCCLLIALLAISTPGCSKAQTHAVTGVLPSSDITTGGTITSSGNFVFGTGAATGGSMAFTPNWCADSMGRVFDCNRPLRPKRIGPPIMLAAVRSSAKPIRASLAPVAYLELARSINLDSAATDEIRLTEAILHQGLTVYDAHLVDEYLTDKAEAISVNTRWVWKALRKVDEPERGAQDLNGIMVLSTVYRHPVPATALAKVKELLDEMPDASFFVSDYETVKPDPFLIVTTKRLMEAGKGFIIDQWDEPGFGVVPDMSVRQRRDSTD